MTRPHLKNMHSRIGHLEFVLQKRSKAMGCFHIMRFHFLLVCGALLVRTEIATFDGSDWTSTELRMNERLPTGLWKHAT